MKKIAWLLAAVGVLLAVYAVVGRFVDARSVLGRIIPGGIAASSLMIGANTVLLLAVLANFCCCKTPAPGSNSQCCDKT